MRQALFLRRSSAIVRIRSSSCGIADRRCSLAQVSVFSL
jgi:hypothetical protein